MAASLQPTSSETTILDLNDDCLKEVFAYMDPKTLTNVADVCARFKQNAMHAAGRTIKQILLWFGGEPCVYGYPMLRNFGEFIEQIYVDGRGVEKRVIQYLSMYCVGKSIELSWRYSRITDEIAILLRPLLGRVQKLRFERCDLNEVLLRSLPLWSAGLQESEYGAKDLGNDHEIHDDLRQKNLKSISFVLVPDIENAHIEELFQLNPQLKEIELDRCYSPDTRVLEYIARNVSAIEKLEFVMNGQPSNRAHIKYFRQLHQLKSLTFEVCDDGSYIQLVLHEIASVNTCLDYLDLRSFDLRYNANEFIGDISKLQQLKTLRLCFVNKLTAVHLIEICKHAKELSDIYLEYINTMITNDNLLEIVKNARKLREFEWIDCNSIGGNRTNIDSNTFLKLAKLVDQRNEKTNLSVYLPRDFFTSTISADLRTAVSNLKIKFSSQRE